MTQDEIKFWTIHGLVTEAATIRKTIEAIDRSLDKIALVVDSNRRLLGTVTDGDVRRALLNGRSMEDRVSEIMHTTPIVSRIDEPIEDAECLARRRAVRKVPLIDGSGHVVGIHIVDSGPLDGLLSNPVLLMAGGLGMRLRPLTEHAPKPLLSVGEKPLLETIVDQLVGQGFRTIYFSVRYKAEMVRDHFGDGSRWDSEFRYLNESEPLGTAGALSLIDDIPAIPLVVMNADLLTKIDYRHLLDFHSDSAAAATMAVRAYDLEVPYGVVTTEGDRIVSIEEKPVQKFFVNAGIYVLEPSVLSHIARGERLDMPDLFMRLIKSGMGTAAFPIREYWIDVGRMEDYQKANDDYKEVFEC